MVHFPRPEETAKGVAKEKRKREKAARKNAKKDQELRDFARQQEEAEERQARAAAEGDGYVSAGRQSIWDSSGVAKNHRQIAVACLLVASVCFLGVLWKAIVAPGFVFCDDRTCFDDEDELNPGNLDMPIAVIVSLLYVIATVASVLIVKCPGALMSDSQTSKKLSLVSLLLMLVSMFMLLAPLANREYVATYFSVQQYVITVLPASQGGGTARILATNFYNDLHAPGTRITLQVRKADGDEKHPRDLIPTAKLVYRDERLADAPIMAPGWNRTVEVPGLESGQWYMFLLLPAKDGNLNSKPRPSDNVYRERSGLPPGRNDGLLDMRGFKLCLWDRSEGCIDGIH